MFTDEFSPAEALAVTPCPRCKAMGMLEIDSEKYDSTLPADKYQATHHIDPSIACRCSLCGLVAEWPACLPD